MIDMVFFIPMHSGRMAQWLRHPPTERGIPGSNPGVIGRFFFFLSVLFSVIGKEKKENTLLSDR